MKNAIENYLNFYKKINPEVLDCELELIKSNISILKIKKKETYIAEKTIQKSIGFVHSGLLRSFIFNNEGKQINTAFFCENEFVTDYLSFIKQQKTNYNFDCLENCIIISIPYHTVEVAFKNSINFANFGRLIAEWALEKRTKKHESFLLENAEERYLRFVNENASILNRISQTHLSSYLGIERQTLNRIRTKILTQM
jgi:CRP/FNR family transcriptional regulator